MPYPAPDIRNFTKPGGISVHVDAGAGYEHLGNLDINKMSLGIKSSEIEVKTQLSGEMRLGEVIRTESLESYKLALQEVTPENMQRFFCGGAIEAIGAGSAAVVDQIIALNGEIPTSVSKYGLTAITVRQFLDKVFMYDGAAYTDHSVEADTLDGTPFDTLIDGSDELVLMKNTPFTQVYFDFAVPGVYGAVVVKYWDGSAKQAVAGLGGAAAALAADGVMSFNLPADWAKTTINGYTGYPIFITATTPWTTPATVNEIRQQCVRNTDFIQDPGRVAGGLLAGRIGRLAAGMLADGEEVKVSYTHETWTALRFPVLTAQYPVMAARLDYLTTKGTQMRRNIPKCQLKPDGDIGIDANNLLAIPIMLMVLDDYATTPTAPVGTKEILY